MNSDPNLPPGTSQHHIDARFGDEKPTSEELYERECEKADIWYDQRVDREDE